MSEESVTRRSWRANLRVPPVRYDFENEEAAAITKSVVENKENIIQEDNSQNAEKSNGNVSNKKSVISGASTNTSKKSEIRAKKREIEMKMLQLQMDALNEEEEALTESISFKARSVKELVNRDMNLNGSHSNTDHYDRTQKWVEDVNNFGNFEENIRSDEDKNISKTLVECIKDLNVNIEKLATRNQCNLQDFYGDINEFPLWISEYYRTTEEKRISNSQNLYRLQRSIKGRARDVVKDLFCSPDNVPAIIDTLKMNFGREEWIIMNQVEKVRRLSSPKEDSVESFMQFSVAVSNMVITMKNIGCTKYLENPELLNKLEEKLSRSTRRLWAEEKVYIQQKSNLVNLEHFSDWLKKEINILMSVSISPSITNSRKYSTGADRRDFFNVTEQSHEYLKNCSLCGERRHRLFSCSSFF